MEDVAATATPTEQAVVAQAEATPTIAPTPTAPQITPTVVGGAGPNSQNAATDPVPTPEPPVTKPGETIVYTVVEGDTLGSIAEKYGIDVKTIMAVNGLEDETELAIGQELRILPVSGALHIVAEGDTLEGLAAYYGVDTKTLAEANNLESLDTLTIGQELIVPGGQAPSRVALSSRSGSRAPATEPYTYTVQPGDSLMAIAARAGITVETLLWANDIEDPDTISVGTELLVLPVNGFLYTVEPGDTLNSLAERFDVGAEEILMANGIDDPDTIHVGTKLLLPGGSPVRLTPAPEPTATPVPPTPVPPTPTPEPAMQAADVPSEEPEPTQVPEVVVEPEPEVQPEPEPEPAPASSLGAQSVAIALEFVGYNYTWGGISPSTGFDCTGFVYYIYNYRLGVSMPRDLWGQLSSGTRVSRSEVQAGDIVFFQNTYMPGLSHVGIAIDHDRFVHASSERYGVMVSNLNDAYWAPRWYGATRR